MTMKLYDGLLEEANRDLQFAKVLVRNSLYSSTLYHLEQAFEKAIKSLYSYYSIIHDRKLEADVYRALIGFGHDNSKAIPQIYSKMCDMEESFIHRIEKDRPDLAADPRFPKLKLQSLDMLSNLRKSTSTLENRIRNRTSAEERDLVNNYATEVHKAYQNFRNLSSFIQRLVSDVTTKQQLTSTDNATKPHPFLIFIALSSDLIYCMLIKNDLYRYPFLKFQNENLQILNRAGMEKPCNQLVGIIELFVTNIRPLMKPGGLAISNDLTDGMRSLALP